MKETAKYGKSQDSEALTRFPPPEENTITYIGFPQLYC